MSTHIVDKVGRTRNGNTYKVFDVEATNALRQKNLIVLVSFVILTIIIALIFGAIFAPANWLGVTITIAVEAIVWWRKT